MADPAPGTLPAFAATIFSAPFQLGQRIEHMFSFWYQLAAGETPEWRRFVMTFQDTISQDTADDAQITFDFINYTGGAIDSSWTTGDYDTVAFQLRQIASAWAPFMSTNHRFSFVQAYRMTFRAGWVGSDPALKIFPFNLTGPPEYEKLEGVSGTDTTGSLPPQCAMSVTELVPVRHSWGRFYLPFPGPNAVLAGVGRWKTTTVGTMAIAVHDAYAALASNEFFAVIPITQSQKERVGALEQVTGIRVDDVPDVIRRRRFKHTTYVDTRPLPADAETQPAP